jgi:hypothetical protein
MAEALSRLIPDADGSLILVIRHRQPAAIDSLRPQIQNVNVRPQPRVIRKIPSIMIWIGIEHDVVAIPQPIAYIVVIVRRHLEEVPADVEPIAAATS